MARLHEYQGKRLLREVGFGTPEGEPAFSAEAAFQIAGRLNAPVAVKAQVWATGRAGIGGIRFAETPQEAQDAAGEILGLKVGDFPVEVVLVERKIEIEREFYAGVIIDDRAACPLVMFSSRGGTGIEEIAREHPEDVAQRHVDIHVGLRPFEARDLVRRVGVRGKLQMQLAEALVRLWQLARTYEARAAEINPLVLTRDGRLLAADCRVTVDDYAIFRHPELGIEVAREFGHPPTPLERIAYKVEESDYRGTFYFIQLASGFKKGEGYVGFHGAGGGGSMMSMDALVAAGFKLANFTDTSGNPSSNKVYRAARIILSVPHLDGYFGSGSGVASQEQFHSAYGLAKAFWEVELGIPAVIRLGGNSEDRAVNILEEACRELPGKVEGYKKDDTPDFCAERFRRLVEEAEARLPKCRHRKRPFVPSKNALIIPIADGTVYIDLDQCDEATNAVMVEMCPGILEIKNGKPALAISQEEARSGRFVGWIGCEVECRMRAKPAVYVDLPIEGLEEWIVDSG